MSIDRIGRPDPDKDADKPDSTRPPVADLPRSRKSANEELLDAMAEGRIIGRDIPRQPDDGSSEYEAHRSSDTDNPEPARSSATDTPRVRKSVNEEFLDAIADGRTIRREDPRETIGDRSEAETHRSSDADNLESMRPPAADLPRSRKSANEEFLDAMDGGWIVGHDDPRETVSDRSRSETRSDDDELTGHRQDSPGGDRDRPSTDEDARTTVDEPDRRPDHDVPLGDDTEGPPEGDRTGDGAADRAIADGSAAQDMPDSEEGRQDPDTDQTLESEDGPSATSAGSERETPSENRDQPLADKDARAVVVDEPAEHTPHHEADGRPGPDDVLLRDGTEGPPEGDRSGDGVAEQASEDGDDEGNRESDGGEQDPSTAETLEPADEPVRRPPADWDGSTTELRRGDELYPGARTPFARNIGLNPDTCYHVEGRGNFFTDETGRVVRAEMPYGGKGDLNGDLNNPRPNMTYVVTPDVIDPADGFDYRHEFTTDSEGQIVEAQTDTLAFGEATRSKSVQNRIGKIGGEGFEGGHLFARWFGGGPESLNLVPMHWEINRGAGNSFGNLESRWAKLMEGNPPVAIGDVKLKPRYPDGSRVPNEIVVTWTEDGVPKKKRFSKDD